ncbi:thioredoxin [Halovenus halobia]|uniref:thioredoxin n=1 Tax=Halovenus halobia TaxID=3396622 RepID=UPI003F56489C
MSDEIEAIKRQKLAELRNQAEAGTAEQSDSQSLPEPVSISGGAELTELTDEFDTVLVDFYADWCGPCQMLEPVVETIASETEATVGKIDIDANQPLAAEYGVRGVPTLLLFDNGQPVERLVGMQSEEQLRSVVEQHT